MAIASSQFTVIDLTDITVGSVPLSPVLNQLWLDSSVTPNILQRWDGFAWVKASPTKASDVGAFGINEGSSLSDRVATAEQKITPAAITSTVENNTNILASKAYVQTAADGTKIAAEQQIRNEYGETISNIETNFVFDVNGLKIGKAGSAFSTKIDNNEMGFYDGSTKTAYVSGGEFLINKGTVISSLTIGVHKIEKYSSGITIFRFVG